MQFLVVFVSAVAAFNVVLASPFNQRISRHHAIAARAPVPVPVINAPAPVLRKRQSRGSKCRPNPSSTSALSSAAPTSPAAAPTTPAAVPAASPSPTPVAVPTPDASPAPAPAPAPATPAGGSSQGWAAGFMEGTQQGDGTFYNIDGGTTACGISGLDDNSLFVAMATDVFGTYPGAGANPNLNPICNKVVRVTYNGNSVDCPVVDRCPGCAPGSLDLSVGAFNKITGNNPGLGRIHITWVHL